MKNTSILTHQPINYLSTLILFLITTLGAELSAQSFAEPIMNPFGLTNVTESALPTFVDLDLDGDMDLLVGEADLSTGLGKFNYFENIGTITEPQYAESQINPFDLSPEPFELLVPTFVDLDGDGDMDLSTIAIGDNFIVIYRYYENIGDSINPKFTLFVDYPYGLDIGGIPVYVDLDGDGDIDIFADSGLGLLYFENIGSQSDPQFADQVEFPFGLVADDYLLANSVDFDNDGDIDLISRGFDADLYFHENKGTVTDPEFNSTVQILIELSPYGENALPTFADLDNDGDMDLLVGEDFGNMQYFENTEIVSTNEQFSNIEVALHPNPVSNVLEIETDSYVEKIEIYSMVGKLINTYSGEVSTINVSNWKVGVYVFKMWDVDGAFITKKVVKE